MGIGDWGLGIGDWGLGIGMEAVRSGGDLENLGGDSKYTKTVVCPDGCVIFKLTAKPLGNPNFHKGKFWDYPDETEEH